MSFQTDGDAIACPHSSEYIGRVSWPADLAFDPKRADIWPASGCVCDQSPCQDRAANMVARYTGHRGVFVAYSEQRTIRTA